MTNKILTAAIAVVAVVALVFGFLAYKHASQAPTQPFGAVSTLGVSPLVFNGITHYYQPIAFNTASSTLCTYRTTATTTLSAASVQILGAASGAQLTLGVGTYEGATTTTFVAAYSVPTGGQVSFNSTSTPSESLYPDNILPPRTWISLNEMVPSNVVSGSCGLELRGFGVSTQ